MNARILGVAGVGLIAAAIGGAQPATGERLAAADFVYLGAFRLPAGGVRPRTFAYGGAAMAFRPYANSATPADAASGSLFVVGHPRLAYGELPDGGQLGEIAIPKASPTREIEALPRARFLQGFHDVARGRFKGLDEIPRMGLLYLETRATGPLLHIAWGQHFQPDPPAASHGAVRPTLDRPEFIGEWFIEAANPYAVQGYLMEIPREWAEKHAGGRVLATGRYRDGGWSGLGPSLYAYRPWDSQTGSMAAHGAMLTSVTLLQYPTSRETETMERAFRGYQHADEWEGGAWITTRSGKTAVLFAGTKGVGAKYWYGFAHPRGPERVCVHGASVGDFPACRTADGGTCAPADLRECAGHNDSRGWWSMRFAARFVLYDPDDFAKVIAGKMKASEPQPYAHVDIDPHLFLNPGNVETEMLGSGPQRRFRIGGVAYDRAGDRLYVLEPFADESQPVVHVWRLR